MAKAIFEKINGKELSEINKIHKYRDARRVVIPDHFFKVYVYTEGGEDQSTKDRTIV